MCPKSNLLSYKFVSYFYLIYAILRPLARIEVKQRQIKRKYISATPSAACCQQRINLEKANSLQNVLIKKNLLTLPKILAVTVLLVGCNNTESANTESANTDCQHLICQHRICQHRICQHGICGHSQHSKHPC